MNADERRSAKICFYPRLLFKTVVWSFFSNNDVVDVRFFETRRGYPKEARPLLKFRYRSATRVTHSRTQTTDELSHHFRECALVRHASFDPFRNEFRVGFNLVLRITIARAFPHRA